MVNSMNMIHARYPFIIVWLHWLTLLLVTAQLAIGYLTDELVEDKLVFSVHVVLGSALLILTLLRLSLKMIMKKHMPPKPEKISAKEWLLAKIGHYALYALLIAGPVTGLAAWLLSENFEEIHETVITLLWVVIAGHILAVIKHRVFEKENLLTRMRF